VVEPLPKHAQDLGSMLALKKQPNKKPQTLGFYQFCLILTYWSDWWVINFLVFFEDLGLQERS
jgi:hypothetical protein